MATWDVSSTWILEIISAGLSVVSLAALVGVLVYTDGRELVTWHNLTLNTVISILSTISRLCAIFVLGEAISQVKWAIFSKNARSLLDFEAIDAASRGPIGAFWLLFRKKKIAIVGAAAILLALAFDPFAQQLVRLLPEVDYALSPNATLPHAQSYRNGNRVATAAVVGLERGGARVVTANADFGMQSDIYYGLTQPLDDVSQQLKAKCPTGNCTWPASESLAVCSVCNNVSSDLKSSTKTGMSSAALMDTSNAGASFGEVTRYELSNRLSIDNYNKVAPQLLLTSLGTGNRSETVSMSDVDTLIWSMTMLRVRPEDQDESSKWPEVSLDATECALYYCVKRYESSITSNDLNSTSTVVTSASRDPESWQPVASSVEQYQANLTASDVDSLAFDASLSAVERTDLRLGQGYNISQAAVNGLSSFFTETFAASVSNMNITNGFYMASSANTQYKPPAIQPLVTSSNLTDPFAAVAESMSNAIRASDTENTEIGLMGTPITRYVVHWSWLALPIFVIFASVAQLVVTIHYSKNTPLWKNSSLAVMSRGRYVSGLLGEEANTVTAMQQAVGKQRVQLFPGRPVREESNVSKDGMAASASAVELTRYPSAYSSGVPTRLATPNEEDIPSPMHVPVSKI